MNTKLIGALLVGIVIGVVIGYVAAPKSGLQHGQGFGGQSATIQAYISPQQDGSCSQTVGPDPEDFVVILKNGTTIEWMGKTAAMAPQVSFSPDNSPFTQSSFAKEADTGAVKPGAPLNTDYPFSAVSVFDTSSKQWVACNLKLHPMGVHVTN